MRYIRYAFLALLGVVLVTLALANRAAVTLALLPDPLAGLFGLDWTVTLPLFLVILGGIVAGLLIGFVWEWLREHKHRADVARKDREIRRLQREVRRLKGEKHEGQDEVLALLDEPA